MGIRDSTRQPETKRRVALITGGSSGIGEAFAEVFAADGFDLVLTARREDRLHAVQDRLQQRYDIHVDTIVADLSQRDASERVCAEIAARGVTVDALVNSAGYGVPGAYVASSWDTHAAFIQVMVTAVAELTHRVLPGMIERRYGRIVNVASLAGLVPSPAGNTLYAASKAFLIKFSESLAHEVRRDNVHATAVCPGFTFSEFHDVTGTRAAVNRLPRFMWMDAATVARKGHAAVMAGESIVITGRVNSAIATLVRILPQRLIVGVGRRIGRSYRRV